MAYCAVAVIQGVVWLKDHERGAVRRALLESLVGLGQLLLFHEDCREQPVVGSQFAQHIMCAVAQFEQLLQFHQVVMHHLLAGLSRIRKALEGLRHDLGKLVEGIEGESALLVLCDTRAVPPANDPDVEVAFLDFGK